MNTRSTSWRPRRADGISSSLDLKAGDRHPSPSPAGRGRNLPAQFSLLSSQPSGRGCSHCREREGGILRYSVC